VHLDIIKDLHLPTDAFYISLINTKIYIKTYINISPTCIALRPSPGTLHLSLAKVTFIKIIGKSTSLWTMRWYGSMLYQVHGGMCAVHTYHHGFDTLRTG